MDCPSLINVVLYKLLPSVHLGNKPGVMKSDNDIDTDLSLLSVSFYCYTDVPLLHFITIRLSANIFLYELFDNQRLIFKPR